MQRLLRLTHLTLLTTAGRTLLLSLLLYFLAFQFLKFTLWRDPHSAFFDDRTVYNLQYSLFREHEALHYISEYNAAIDPPSAPLASSDPTLCVAVGTIRRNGSNYLDASVGSMLAGLDERERAAMKLSVFFMNTEPRLHPSWGERWLERLSDEVLTYKLNTTEMGALKEMEREHNFNDKGVFDYIYMLNHCYDANTPYIAIFEDDIILADGWLAQSLRGLSTIKNKEVNDWLYLRLFYTETFLSWTDEDFWYRNMPMVFVLAMGSVFGSMMLVRRVKPSLQRQLDWPMMAVTCLVVVPAFTGLVFMMGKYNVMPMRGVVEMNSHGCCSQGMIFPREQIPALIEFLQGQRGTPTDSSMEIYADRDGLRRYALAPAQLQHVGTRSSRGSIDPQTHSVWAFWFEANKPERLRAEHERLLQSDGIPWI